MMPGDTCRLPWSVVVTGPRLERMAQKQFREAAIETFLPLREQPPTPEHPLVVVPMWAGYLFAKARHIPERAYAARHFIATHDGKIILVPDGIVEAWQSVADADGLVERYVAPVEVHYAPGDAVRVTCGHLAGAIVRVAWQTGERVKVALACQTGEILVSLPTEQIAPAEFGAVSRFDADARRRAI